MSLKNIDLGAYSNLNPQIQIKICSSVNFVNLRHDSKAQTYNPIKKKNLTKIIFLGSPLRGADQFVLPFHTQI